MKKINIAKLLKDCPKGMELDCTEYDGIVKFDGFNKNNPYIIRISVMYDGEVTIHSLTKYGQTSVCSYNKCVIYPKGKNTWEGFQRPFKDGDILVHDDTIYIYNGLEELSPYQSHYVYVIADKNGLFAIDTSTKKYGTRFATEEEKEILFKAIKANGYKWNAETKTLEKLIEPKFKIGDRIKVKGTNAYVTIKAIKWDKYNTYYETVLCDISVEEQDNWELVPNKFDISTLVPFESKVLVRNDEIQRWIPAFWGYKVEDGFITTFGWCKYCIPHKGNENLFKTNNDCDDFYKIWE